MQLGEKRAFENARFFTFEIKKRKMNLAHL